MTTYQYRDMKGNIMSDAAKIDLKVDRVFGRSLPNGLFEEDTTEYRGVRYHDDIVDEIEEIQPELDL